MRGILSFDDSACAPSCRSLLVMKGTCNLLLLPCSSDPSRTPMVGRLGWYLSDSFSLAAVDVDGRLGFGSGRGTAESRLEVSENRTADWSVEEPSELRGTVVFDCEEASPAEKGGEAGKEAGGEGAFPRCRRRALSKVKSYGVRGLLLKDDLGTVGPLLIRFVLPVSITPNRRPCRAYEWTQTRADHEFTRGVRSRLSIRRSAPRNKCNQKWLGVFSSRDSTHAEVADTGNVVH